MRRSLLLAAVVAVLVAACSDGGGDDDGSAADTTAVDPTTTTSTTRPPSATSSFPITMESPADLPGYHVYRPADLDATVTPLPVVVWANGGCFRFDGVWQPLLEQWAAAGFFVVAIAAPPSGAVDQTDLTTAADQALAIDWAVEQNGLADGSYAGHLDLDRVVGAGNSCGGITTIALASTDARVTAAFVLSGSGSAPGSPPEQVAAAVADLTVPVAYVVGGPEDIARTFSGQDYEVMPEGLPVYIARRASGDHPTVSTTEAILVDEVAAIGINWFDLALYGTESAMDTLLNDPCPTCPPGQWTEESKNVESLASS